MRQTFYNLPSKIGSCKRASNSKLCNYESKAINHTKLHRSVLCYDGDFKVSFGFKTKILKSQ